MKLYRLFIVLLVYVGLFAAGAGAQEQAEHPGVDPNAIRLTLQQAVEMALESNLDIVVSRLETQVRAEGVSFARGVYKPFISLGINTLNSASPAQNQLVGAQTLTSTRSNYNFVWQQQVSTGGNYFIQWANLRSTTNSAFAGFNPLYDTSALAQITQPLMANFGTDASKQQILVAQNVERISRSQFEIQVMNTVRDVEFAYWDLVFAIRDLDVARGSLQLAQDLLRNNRIQVEVGTMAPIDVLEAEAEVAAREETVILAEELIRVTEDILKRLINDPTSPDFWESSYAPVDQPMIGEVEVDVDDAVRIALSRRPVLEQSRVELETRSYNLRYAKNQLMPQLDVVGSLAFNGIGGTQLVREDFAGTPSLIIPGGYGDAINQVFGGDFRDWSIGLNVSYPLGNSQAQAQHAQAQIAARQQRALISSNEILIAQEVRRAAGAVETNRKRIDATRVARDLSQRRLEAEQKKFEVGMSTSFLIVQAQRDLSLAAASELRALIDFVKAIAALERAKGTILDRSNVAVR